MKSLSIPQLTRGTPRADLDFDVVSLWPDVDEVQDQVFDQTAADDKAIQVQLSCVGFSQLFNYSDTARDFMEALSASTDLPIFRTRLVQTFINFKKRDVVN